MVSLVILLAFRTIASVFPGTVWLYFGFVLLSALTALFVLVWFLIKRKQTTDGEASALIKKGIRWAALAVTVITVTLIGELLMIPPFVVHRCPATTPDLQCQWNLRILDAAVEQWAFANNKTNGDRVVTNEIIKYVRPGRELVCPDGGTYDYSVVGRPPTCSIFQLAKTNYKVHKRRVNWFFWVTSPCVPEGHSIDKDGK